MTKKKPTPDSALHVHKGIDQPSAVNPAFASGIQKYRKETLSVDTLTEGILAGNRSILSRGITLIESARSDHQEIAQELINRCLPHSGKSLRLGITGVPGAGKSTFIEAFGIYLIGQGHKVAVLAIDPSSQRTKGSILGDKTRMEQLSTNPNAFIRPSATAGTLGGVTRATREAVILCEAAGFDYIIIETVGVGQSETAVAQIVDFFLLLMIAGGGDELQGIKRGIMEMADLIVINKADGDNIKRAELAKREYKNALHLFPVLESGWTPKVLTASSLYNKGLTAIMDQIASYLELTKENSYFDRNRQEQSLYILHDSIKQALSNRFFNDKFIRQMLATYEQQIMAGQISPYQAAQTLLEAYFTSLRENH